MDTRPVRARVALKSLLLASVVLAALTFSAASLAGIRTDGPRQQTIVLKITDKGMTITDQASFVRGTAVTFAAFNSGTKVHDFALLGKTTGPIKPNHWGRITMTLVTRGKFLGGSTLDKGTAFHQYYIVR